MKKLLFLLIVMFITSVTVSAQHFKFMGIEITGSLNDFTTKLEQKGFLLAEYVNKNERMFIGDFAGEKVLLRVHTTPKSLIVWNVAVQTSYFKTSERSTSLFKSLIQKEVIAKFPALKKTEELENDYVLFTDPNKNEILVRNSTSIFEEPKRYYVVMSFTDGANYQLCREEEKALQQRR